MSGSIEVAVLGPVQLRMDGEHVPLKGALRRALLARLAMSAGVAVSSDRLADELWSTTGPDTARALHVQVARLRHLLEPQRAKGSPPTVLVTEASGYRLRLDADQLDATRFERQVAESERLLRSGRAADAHARASEALALWRGRAYEDVPTELASTEAARLEEMRKQAVELRCDAALSMGREAAAIADLQALVASDPLREGARRRLMVALYRVGRQAEALRVYQDLREQLRTELGIDPSPELQQLETAMLQQQPELGTALRPKLVGRDRELAVLEAALHELARGRGDLLLVQGEPGIGKTTLVTALASAASDVATVTWGHCWPGPGAPPFWPWIEVVREHLRSTGVAGVHASMPGGSLLGRLLPELAGPLAPGEGADDELVRFRLYDAVCELLSAAARGRPQVVVLEDLHWADPASLQVLRFLAPRCRHAPLLVIGTYREAELRERPLLKGPLVDASRQGRRIDLRGLGLDDVAQLLALTTGRDVTEEEAARISAATGGNPLFVHEYASLGGSALPGGSGAMPGAAVPDGVREVIRWRLAALGESVVEALAAGAVWGPNLDVPAVAELLGRSTVDVLDPVERAVQHGLLDAGRDPRTFAFRHDLVRQTLYEDLAAARRAALHERAARRLRRTSRSGRDGRAAEIAHHLLAARPVVDDADVAAAARDAGREAMQTLAYEDAAAWYRRALEVTPEEPAAEAPLLLAEGEAWWLAGDVGRSSAVLHDAASAARRAGDRETLARAALALGGGHLIASELTAADVALMEEAARSLAVDDPLRIRLLARLGCVQAYRSEHPESIGAGFRYAREALDLARCTSDPSLLVHGLFAQHFVLDDPIHDDDRTAIGFELLETARSVGSPLFLLWGWGFHAFDLFHAGDTGGARAAIDRSLVQARELRQPFYLAAHGMLLPMIDLVEGRFEQAEEGLQEAASAFHALDAPVFRDIATAGLIQLRSWQGRPYSAPNPGSGDRALIPHPLYVVLHGALRHEPFDARQLRSAVDVLERWSQVPLASYALGHAATRCAELAEPELASRLYAALGPYRQRMLVAGRPPMPAQGSGSLHLGALATVMERFDEAERHLCDAMEHHQRIASPPWVVWTGVRYAQMLQRRGRRGDRTRADAVVDRAATTASELDMAGALTALEQLA